MKTFEVRFRRTQKPIRPASAFILPGGDPALWLELFATLPEDTEEPEFYLVPRSRTSPQAGGLLLRYPHPPECPAPPLALAFEERVANILLPIDAEFDPPVRGSEIRKALPWPLLLFHPHVGPVGFTPDDKIELESLVSPPQRRRSRFAWSCPGCEPPGFAGLAGSRVARFLRGRSIPVVPKSSGGTGSASQGRDENGPLTLDPDILQTLPRREVQRIAREALRRGYYLEAAIIYHEVLNEPLKAADALQKGKYYVEASSIYRTLERYREAARCLELAGLFEEAAKMLELAELPEQAGDLYAKCGMKADAVRCWEAAVEVRLSRGAVVGAARIVEEKLADPKRAANLLEDGLDKGLHGVLDRYLGLAQRWGLWHRQTAALNRMPVPADRSVVVEYFKTFAAAAPRPQPAWTRLAVEGTLRRFLAVLLSETLPEEEVRVATAALRKSAPDDELLPFDILRYHDQARAATGDLETRVVEILADVEQLDPRRCSIDRNLRDFMDSLGTMAFVMELEDAFDIAISDEETEKLKTARDFANLVRRHLGQME